MPDLRYYISSQAFFLTAFNMIKIVNGIKLDLNGVSNIVTVPKTDHSINQYLDKLIITGTTSGDFIDNEVIDDIPIIPFKYQCNEHKLTVGSLNIESYSCLPTTIVIATVNRSDFKILDLPDQLLIACPESSSENDLINYIKSNKLVNYNITGGSDNAVGNILYRLSEVTTRPYDSYGRFTIEQYYEPTIDAGLVIKAFNSTVKSVFPDFGYTIAGDQQYVRGSDYIEYTIQDFGKYGRPYINALNRYTSLDTLRVRLDIVIKDTVKYMNILRLIRTYELLVNIGTFITKDKKGNDWKCAIDWGESMSESTPGQVRGNYSKQAGYLISIDCSIRYFSVPSSPGKSNTGDSDFNLSPIEAIEVTYTIEEIESIYKYLIK